MVLDLDVDTRRTDLGFLHQLDEVAT